MVWIEIITQRSVFMPFLAAVIITLLIASILGTAAAYIAQTVSQKTTSVTLVEMIFVFEAIFAAGASWLMLGEELGVFAILGCTLILIGMMIVGK